MTKQVAEERIRQVPKKRTMMKARVGCVRTTTYNLPDASHTYGAMKKADEESAGEIISNWVTTNPSSGKTSSASHVHTNILAIKNGCITAASMRKYTEEHPNIRLKEVVVSGGTSSDAMVEGPFGKSSEQTNPQDFTDIMQTKFTDYSTEDSDYPVLKGFVMHGYMPKPRDTRSSAMLAKYIKQKEQDKEKKAKRFCMKRFQNVQSNFAKIRAQEQEEDGRMNSMA